jgi:ABC-2 type transport system ATP-binding protein
VNDAGALVVEGLTKIFAQRVAVDHVSFSVRRGCFFGFLGPSGAGKSTTVRMLSGLLRPTAGDAVIEDVRLSRDLLGVKRRIGLLGEDLALYERLTGEEHLLFVARMHGLPRDEARRRTEDLLDALSLAGERGELVVDLSPGARKKLALACTLVHNPRLVFLDGPLDEIDPVSGRVMADLLRRLVRRGVTLFFTSRLLDVVERLCDEVAIIDRGCIVAQGPMDVIQARRAHGGDVALEDVFVKLVDTDLRREDLSWIG